MTITAAQLRQDYPEFTSTTAYPDSSINYWINMATLMLNTNRWGAASTTSTLAIYDIGMELFVAHNIVLEAKAQAEAAAGAPPGSSTGPVSSKSVGPVSVSYDTQAGIEKDAGHWNLTIYGTRFIKLAKQFGAGPIQVGVDACSWTSGAAYNGPYDSSGIF